MREQAVTGSAQMLDCFMLVWSFDLLAQSFHPMKLDIRISCVFCRVLGLSSRPGVHRASFSRCRQGFKKIPGTHNSSAPLLSTVRPVDKTDLMLLSTPCSPQHKLVSDESVSRSPRMSESHGVRAVS